jgi:hypothetical protein
MAQIIRMTFFNIAPEDIEFAKGLASTMYSNNEKASYSSNAQLSVPPILQKFD